MRAAALLIQAAYPDCPIQACPLQAAEGLLAGFDTFQALIRDGLALPVVPQFHQKRVALPREKVSNLLVVDLYHADPDSLISNKSCPFF